MLIPTVDFFSPCDICVHFLIVVVAVAAYFLSSRKSQIPGPCCLPIVGYLPFIGFKPHETFIKLARKYGPVFKLKCGTVDVVILNGWNAIKEAMLKEDLFARPKLNFGNLYFNVNSFGFMDGNDWKEQRIFANRIMKNLGVGKEKMESVIEASIEELCSRIDQENGEPKNVKHDIVECTANVLLTYLTGRRFSSTEKLFADFINANEMFTESSAVGLFAFFPKIAKLFAKIEVFGFQKWKHVLFTIRNFSRSLVTDYDTRNVDDEATEDFITLFIRETKSKAKTEKEANIYKSLLVGTLHTYLIAGVDSVSTSITWILLISIYFPHYQKKIQKEIDEVVGNDRSPCYADRSRMLFTQAFILETQRWLSIQPLNIPRRALKETTVQGIRIPKDMQVIANFHSVNNDNTIWEDASVFIPYRFISQDEKRIVNTEKLLTFSYGKRSCPGEALANAEMFVITTNLLQRYNILSVDGTKPSLDYNMAVVISPKEFKVKFETRSK